MTDQTRKRGTCSVRECGLSEHATKLCRKHYALAWRAARSERKPKKERPARSVAPASELGMPPRDRTAIIKHLADAELCYALASNLVARGYWRDKISEYEKLLGKEKPNANANR